MFTHLNPVSRFIPLPVCYPAKLYKKHRRSSSIFVELKNHQISNGYTNCQLAKRLVQLFLMFGFLKLGKKNSPSLEFIAFLQALGLIVYCSLVGLIIFQGNSWFGPLTAPFGPILFLLLFVVSALISASLVLAYPFLILWEEKNTRKAIKLVIYTTLWLILFVLVFLMALASVNYR